MPVVVGCVVSLILKGPGWLLYVVTMCNCQGGIIIFPPRFSHLRFRHLLLPYSRLIGMP